MIQSAGKASSGSAAIAQVIHDAVAEHVVVRVRFGHSQRRFADDDGELAFPVDVPAGRNEERLAWIDDARAGRLREEDWIFLVRIGFVRRLLLRTPGREHLTGVQLVVRGRREDVVRIPDRCLDRDLVELEGVRRSRHDEAMGFAAAAEMHEMRPTECGSATGLVAASEMIQLKQFVRNNVKPS